MKAISLMLKLAVIMSVTVLAGCTVNKVAPWERGNLAKQVMVRGGSQHMGLEQHFYASKETTSGGYSVGAGGCGCN